MTQTALYRHYDAGGRLLYAGISLNAVNRLSQHSAKPWFREIARVTTEWFPSRTEASEAERKAIRGEAPIHNVRHAVYQRSMAVMPPAHEAGISMAHYDWISNWFTAHLLGDGVVFASDMASRIMGVAESTILRMVTAPPGMSPGFSPSLILQLADRLVRGRFDAEAPIIAEDYRPQFVPFVRECEARAAR